MFGTVRAFDLTTSIWSKLPNLAVARHGLAVAAIGNTLYAIDGAAEPGHNASTRTVQILTVPPGPLSLPGVGSWGMIRCTRSSRWVRRCWMAGSGWLAV